MTWTFVGVSSIAEVASNDLTLTEPAGVQDGDLLVACISYRSTSTWTVPSGWSNVNSQNSGNTTNQAATAAASGRMDYIVRNGAPSLTWTRPATAEVAQGCIAAYRPSAGKPILAQNSGNTLGVGAGSTTASTPALTTTEENELLVMACCAARPQANATAGTVASNQRATSPAAGSWTERTDAGTLTGNDGGLAVADAIKPALGTTNTFNWTAAQSARHATIVGAFRSGVLPINAGAYTLSGKPVSFIHPGINVFSSFVSGIEIDTGTSGTVTGVPIGPADNNRLIVMQISSLGTGNGSTSGEITSVVIGGVTATKIGSTVTDSSNFLNNTQWYAAVPLGTTANITVTYTSNVAPGGGQFPTILTSPCYGVAVNNPIFDSAAVVHNDAADGNDTSTLITIEADIDIAPNGNAICQGPNSFPNSASFSAVWTNTDFPSGDQPVSQANVTQSTSNYWSQAGETNRHITYGMSCAAGFITRVGCLMIASLNPSGVIPKIIADTGTYALAGQAVSLKYNRRLPVNTGAYALAGQDNLLKYARKFPVDAGAYTYNGLTVGGGPDLRLQVNAGAYALQGKPVNFIITEPFQWAPEAAAEGGFTGEAPLTNTWTPDDPVSEDWDPNDAF